MYVEGLSKDSGELKVNWELGGESIQNGDRLKVTAFEWSGPQNVPGYSIHNYKADGALAASKWVTPSDGTIKTGANTSDATILWGKGQVVGKAVYEVNDKYTWDLGVNVVEVELDFGTPNSITYVNPPIQSGGALIRSCAVGSGAVNAQIEVKNIKGPVVAGSMRGVKFMEVGMLQNAQHVAKQGYFDHLPKAAGAGMGRQRVSSLVDGVYHLDTITGSTSPWYDSANVSGGAADGVLTGLTDAAVTSTMIDMSDTPLLLGSDTMSLTEGANTDAIDRIAINFALNLYLGVRTIEAVNGSDDVYTQRASSSWTFNGSGTFDAAGSWTAGAAAGNSGDAKFSEVKTGTVIPVTTGTTINDDFATETWSTGDQP